MKKKEHCILKELKSTRSLMTIMLMIAAGRCLKHCHINLVSFSARITACRKERRHVVMMKNTNTHTHTHTLKNDGQEIKTCRNTKRRRNENELNKQDEYIGINNMTKVEV